MAEGGGAEHCLALILTGMGTDGALGAQQLKRAGARIIAESAETAVVFGMPKAAAELGSVDEQLPLSEIVALVQGFAAKDAS